MKGVALLVVGIGLVACGSSPSSQSVAQSASAQAPVAQSPSPLPPATASSGSVNEPTPTPSRQPQATVDPPSPGPIGWVTFRNSVGQFTYSVPADWQAVSCEDGVVGYVAAPGNCSLDEQYQAFLFAISLEGDQRANIPPSANSYAYLAPITGTTAVTVAGVSGQRYTARVNASLPLPPPKGTEQVAYVFYNGHQTYLFVYDHLPAEPDRTADFDRSVQEMLSFSA